MGNRAFIVVCVAVAAAVRVGLALYQGPHLRFPDEERFWTEALNMAADWSLRSGGSVAHDMPLTALFFGCVVKLFGPSVMAAKIAGALLGALAVVPAALMAREVHRSRLAVACAAAITALYPYYVFFSTLLLSEALFIFFLGVMFWLLLRPGGSGLMHGAAGAAVFLARPTLLYFMPVVWAWMWFVRRDRWHVVVLAVLLFAVAVGGWTLRNHRQLGIWLPTTSSSGMVLWEGNNPWNTDGGVASAQWGWLDQAPASGEEAETYLWWKAQGTAYILEHPGRFAHLAWKKFLRFWHLWPNAEGLDRGLYKWAALLSFGPVLALALLSLVAVRRFRTTGLLWLCIGYYTAIHMVTLGSVRYRLPLDILLIVLAAACVAGLAGARETRRETYA